MTIVVGYSADPFGRAALEHGIGEAKLRGTTLCVINSTSGEAYVDSHFAQQARFVELVQRVVDGGQRNADPGLGGFTVQLLGADMPMRPAEQQFRQRHALPCGPQARHAQNGGKARSA